MPRILTRGRMASLSGSIGGREATLSPRGHRCSGGVHSIFKLY